MKLTQNNRIAQRLSILITVATTLVAVVNPPVVHAWSEELLEAAKTCVESDDPAEREEAIATLRIQGKACVHYLNAFGLSSDRIIALKSSEEVVDLTDVDRRFIDAMEKVTRQRTRILQRRIGGVRT